MVRSGKGLGPIVGILLAQPYFVFSRGWLHNSIVAYELITVSILDNNSSSIALHRCGNVIFSSFKSACIALVQFQVSKIHDIDIIVINPYFQFRFVGSEASQATLLVLVVVSLEDTSFFFIHSFVDNSFCCSEIKAMLPNWFYVISFSVDIQELVLIILSPCFYLVI